MAAANLQYDAPPSVWVSFAKAAKPGAVRLRSGQDIPRLEAHLAPAPASTRTVNKYRKLCGFDANGLLPVTFPHIMAAPLHMAVLTHDAFPLKLLGAVHMRNAVHQYRALHENEPLAVHVAVEGHRPVDKGLILIGADLQQLAPYVELTAEEQQRLAAGWPAPLTWLVPVTDAVPAWVRGEHPKVAIRVPDHPLARELCRLVGHPIISTSANLSGRPSARNRFQVARQLGDQLDFIVSGACDRASKPSTIIDLESGRTLRA